jgi:organic hydroperoxide reductase OsmC/OhrA
MSEHIATVRWRRGEYDFADGRYSRGHAWHFDGGAVVHASASPNNVPEGTADVAGVDPEEAFVASLSSCHMLWFLALAARDGLIVDSYEDAAVGTLSPNDRGGAWLSKVTLRPRIAFKGGAPGKKLLAELHHEAHEKCFIAASIRSEIAIEPRE